MTWAAIAIGLAIVLALVFVAQRWGASRERGKSADADALAAKRMLDAQADAPRDKRELVDRLRDGGL